MSLLKIQIISIITAFGISSAQNLEVNVKNKVIKTEKEWLQILTPEEYHILRESLPHIEEYQIPLRLMPII